MEKHKTLEPGDVVKLASGGPLMTVVSVTDDKALCAWFNDDGVLCEGTLSCCALGCHEEGGKPTPKVPTAHKDK